jgi:hypothetical protein
MDAVLSRFFVSLLTQLPVFVVFCVGLRMAWQQRASQPTVARLTSLAFGILLVNAVGMTGVSMWLPPYGLARGWGGSGLQTAFTMLSVVRHLIEAVAFTFLLRAIFSGSTRADGPVRARSRGCLGLFLGGVLGAVSGAVLALVLGEPIGIAFNIRTFEGERGFFIAFILGPLFAIVGAITGVSNHCH